jgi:hypothetical protein
LPDVSIRSYRDGDEQAILDLFHRRFHPDRTLDHWRWKFRNHPRGEGLASLALDEHGALVAHSAGYPALLVDARQPPSSSRSDGTRTLRCLQVGDVMADPTAPRGGLGASLSASTLRHLFEQARAAGMQFTYGTAGAKSDRFYLRSVQRQLLGPAAYRSCDAQRLAKRLRRTRPHRAHLSVETVDRARSEMDRLFARVAASYGVLTLRDAAYLDWRYGRCPDRVHRVYAARSTNRLMGWATFRHIGSSLVWGDALVDPDCPRAAAALLDAAFRDRGTDAVETVEAWFPQQPRWWDRQLEELGFESRPEPQGLRVVYVCVGAEAVDEKALIERLYYTKGDTDLF